MKQYDQQRDDSRELKPGEYVAEPVAAYGNESKHTRSTPPPKMPALSKELGARVAVIETTLTHVQENYVTHLDLEKFKEEIRVIVREEIQAALKVALKDMATKEALQNLADKAATKEDLKSLATKESLENLADKTATKDDLQTMATKEDLEPLATKESLETLATKEDLHASEKQTGKEISESRSSSMNWVVGMAIGYSASMAALVIYVVERLA